MAVSRVAALLLMLLGLGGCSLWQPTVVPMRQLAFATPCASPDGAPPPLLVLLPGRFMRIEELVQQGFVDAVRQQGLRVDVLLVNAHLGYYSDRSVVDRLQADVWEPARQRGVQQVWLAGISLGAFGALLYSDYHPGNVAGLVALGPYLGQPPLAEQIRAAGGLQRWTPASETLTAGRSASEAQVEQGLWRWLKAQADPTAVKPVPVYLGYGSDDRFAPTQQVLAQALPPGQVFTHPGGHDWEAWRPLWTQLLSQLPLPRDAACAAASPPPRPP